MEQKQKTALHSSLSRALSVLFWFFRISSLLRYYGGYKPSRRRKNVHKLYRLRGMEADGGYREILTRK